MNYKTQAGPINSTQIGKHQLEALSYTWTHKTNMQIHATLTTKGIQRHKQDRGYENAQIHMDSIMQMSVWIQMDKE